MWATLGVDGIPLAALGTMNDSGAEGKGLGRGVELS